MPSTYSNLKIQLMATGENNTTWGNVTNLNLGTAIEEAIVGSADVTFASNNQTLTLTDTNASQTARNMRLRCTGTTGGSTRNLVVPSIEKPYIVQNDCADSVVVKTSAGTGITVPAGKTTWVYSDGTNVVDAVNYLSGLTVNGAITAGVASGVTLLMADNSAIRNTATGGNTMYFDSGVGAGSTTGDFNFRSTASFTSRMFINGATGNVGIGTVTPGGATKLNVSGRGLFTSGDYDSFDSTAPGVAICYDTVNNVGIVGTVHTGIMEYETRLRGNTLTFYTNGTNERMRVTSGGNVGIGTAAPGAKLDVNGGIKTARTGVTSPAATDGNIFSGTYTPTLSNIANTDLGNCVAYTCHYMRVGDVVTVSGIVDIAITASGRVRMGMTLPISSSFSATENCGGTAMCPTSGSTNVPVGVFANATNDVAEFNFWASGASAAQSFAFQFTYRVI